MVFTVWIADGRSQIAPGGPQAAPGRFGTPPGRPKERPGGPERALGTPRAFPERSWDVPRRSKRAPGASRGAHGGRSCRRTIVEAAADGFLTISACCAAALLCECTTGSGVLCTSSVSRHDGRRSAKRSKIKRFESPDRPRSDETGIRSAQGPNAVVQTGSRQQQCERNAVTRTGRRSGSVGASQTT